MPENDTTETQGHASNSSEKVTVSYMKSNFFRVIHADGAWGGLAPRGDIHMSFYSERAALPDSGTIPVNSAGKPIASEETTSSSQIVRELECDVVFDLVTAIGLRKWLDEKISDLQHLIKEAKEQQQQRAQAKEQKVS